VRLALASAAGFRSWGPFDRRARLCSVRVSETGLVEIIPTRHAGHAGGRQGGSRPRGGGVVRGRCADYGRVGSRWPAGADALALASETTVIRRKRLLWHTSPGPRTGRRRRRGLNHPRSIFFFPRVPSSRGARRSASGLRGGSGGRRQGLRSPGPVAACPLNLARGLSDERTHPTRSK